MRTTSAALLAGLFAASASLPALAQGASGARDGSYWERPAQVWKNGYGECWRSGSWSRGAATADCDASLAEKPAAPAPRAFAAPPPPQPAPAPAPAPVSRPAPAEPVAAAPVPAPAPKPAPKPALVTFGASDLFGFNSATLTPEARANLDRQIVSRARGLKLNSVKIEGHTDHLGAADYNLKLSQQRAQAVKDYLSSQGIEASKIEAQGYGEARPVKECGRMARSALIACLAPNRRVEILIEGI